MNRYLIIGSGAAGIAAAQRLRELDASAAIQVITQDTHGYYSRPGLAYYLSGEVPRQQLHPLNERHFKDSNIHFLYEEAVRIDSSGHAVNLKGGRILTFDRLLVATGATAMMPDLPGIQLKGVVKLDDYDDAEQIIRMARRNAPAVVVGGGITALELVEGLFARGMQVHYILRGDRYWSNILDETESRLVEQRLIEEGVHIHFQAQVSEILGRGGNVAGVRLQDGSMLPCSLLAFAIGIRPRKELAVRSGLSAKRGILVNQALQTSNPDIFAAGDVAEIVSPEQPEGLLESLWNPAIRQGQFAAYNMAAGYAPYSRSVPLNVTRLAGIITAIIGKVGVEQTAGKDKDLQAIMRGDSEQWRQAPPAVVSQETGGDSRLRVFIGQRSLLGALVMGDQTFANPLHRLVEQQVDTSALRPCLLEPGASLAQLLGNFIQTWKVQFARSIA